MSPEDLCKHSLLYQIFPIRGRGLGLGRGQGLNKGNTQLYNAVVAAILGMEEDKARGAIA